MKIVLVNTMDNRDIHVFSGTPYFMSRAIREGFEEVIEFDAFMSDAGLREAYMGNFKASLEPLGTGLSEFVRKKAAGADFVLCQGGISPIPYYDFSTPIAVWHDSTWHTFLKGYENNRSFETFKSKHKNLYLWDKKVLDRANLLIFSSEYVAEACARNYGISQKKMRTIPFGANIHTAPSTGFIDIAIAKRKQSMTLNLAFLGLDWKRKGLEMACELTILLNSIGIKTRLNVIGCAPPIGKVSHVDSIILHGFLDKGRREEFQLFEEILQSTHFLIHPATSEPFGIALCEANAYGIPIIGSLVEGLKTIVTDGRNGYLFRLETFVKEAAILLKDIYAGFEAAYLPMLYNTLTEFNTRLNWRSNTKELKKTLADYG
jgi:glycosyltransferase involved in cell wall biosynthesis